MKENLTVSELLEVLNSLGQSMLQLPQTAPMCSLTAKTIIILKKVSAGVFGNLIPKFHRRQQRELDFSFFLRNPSFNYKVKINSLQRSR